MFLLIELYYYCNIHVTEYWLVKVVANLVSLILSTFFTKHIVAPITSERIRLEEPAKASSDLAKH